MYESSGYGLREDTSVSKLGIKRAYSALVESECAKRVVLRSHPCEYGDLTGNMRNVPILSSIMNHKEVQLDLE